MSEQGSLPTDSNASQGPRQTGSHPPVQLLQTRAEMHSALLGALRGFEALGSTWVTLGLSVLKTCKSSGTGPTRKTEKKSPISRLPNHQTAYAPA